MEQLNFISNFSKETFKVEIKDYFCHDFGHAIGVIIGNQGKRITNLELRIAIF